MSIAKAPVPDVLTRIFEKKVKELKIYVIHVHHPAIVGNVEAANLAAENGAQIQYAQLSQAPWFTYKKSGIDHVVWFEDPRSIEAKWGLVKEYGLAGAWYWNLMRTFRANWLMTES